MSDFLHTQIANTEMLGLPFIAKRAFNACLVVQNGLNGDIHNPLNEHLINARNQILRINGTHTIKEFTNGEVLTDNKVQITLGRAGLLSVCYYTDSAEGRMRTNLHFETDPNNSLEVTGVNFFTEYENRQLIKAGGYLNLAHYAETESYDLFQPQS